MRTLLGMPPGPIRTFCTCRVPDECPQAIADLHLACTCFDAKKRPKAPEIMRIIEGSMLAIPGAPEISSPSPKEDQTS